MGFWGNFAKIGALAGAGVATAMTGGAAAPLLGVAGKLGSIANIAGSVAPVIGGMAKGRADGKNMDAALGLAQDRNRMDWSDQISNLMATRAMQAKEGDLQANVQDVHIPDNARVKVMHRTGGRRPSAMGPNAREAGSLLSSGALGLMKNDPTMAGGPTPLPQNGFMDDMLSVAGPASSLLGALGPQGAGLFKPRIPGRVGQQPLMLPGQIAKQDPNEFLPQIPSRRIPGAV